MNKPLNLLGTIFGKLVVIKRVELVGLIVLKLLSGREKL